MLSVTMNDFRAEPEALLQAQLAACERVMRSGWWILGKEVAAFEKEWGEFLSSPHVLGCGNGLDAIELGLRALGVGAGDEVITTPMTAFATVLGILRAGAVPVLADIDPSTAMLSPDSVRRCVSRRTKAIILVHLYGQIGAVEELLQIAGQNELHLIEDCAQAHGASWQGRAAGTIGSLGAWSFYPTKNLGAIGDGGALSTSQQPVAEAFRSLRNYGQSVRYHHPLLGTNSRLDELQAAILRERLRYLPQWTARRREIAARYSAGIDNSEVAPLPLPAAAETHVHHLFVVTCIRREALQAHLKSQAVETLIHYPIPVHFQEPCRALQRDPRGLAAAEAHANSCLSLPCHAGLTDEQVDQVIAAVNGFKG